MPEISVFEEMFSDYAAVIIKSLELITAVIATVLWKKYKHSAEKIFIYLLWATLIIEIPVLISFNYYFELNSNGIYNVFFLSNYLFFCYWFYNKLKINLFKYLAIAIVTTSIINLFVQDFFKEEQIYVFIIGSSSILIGSICYYISLLKSNDVFNLKNKLSFWIVTGNLIFYIGIVPLVLFPVFSSVDYRNDVSDYILVILNVILYGSYILGFLLMKNKGWKK